MSEKPEVYKFFDWVSGGLSAASLALFIFTAEYSVDHVSKQVSIILFIVALPLLLGASSVSKDMDVYGKPTKESSSAHNIMLGLGISAFILGLGFLCYLMSGWFSVLALSVSFVVSFSLYSYSYNSLVKRKS